jgi:hypothetical protein
LLSTPLISTGLVLVDPPIKTVVETTKSGVWKSYPSHLLHGGFEDFVQTTSFSSFRSAGENQSWDKNSMLGSLLHYFCNQPPGFRAAQPSILSFGYYPMRIVLAEWMLYTHLTSRYLKYYEYSLNDIQNRLHNNDIVDLQRWRRRIIQSQHKLNLLVEVVDSSLQQEDDKQPWTIMLKDINYIHSQFGHYRHSLEQMIPVATSMVQLLDSRRSIVEAVNVRRLTYIALVFVPLSWVASLFSMSDNYSPGNEHFWVYFATALPLLFLVLLISALRWQWVHIAGKLSVFWKFMTGQAARQRLGVGLA